jgi:hypothetical protein
VHPDKVGFPAGFPWIHSGPQREAEMGDFKTVYELCNRYNLKSFEFFSYVKKGLRLYTGTGLPYLPPGVSEKKSKLEMLEEKKAYIERRLSSIKDLANDLVDPTANLKRYQPTAVHNNQSPGGYRSFGPPTVEESKKALRAEQQKVSKEIQTVQAQIDDDLRNHDLPEWEPQRKKILDGIMRQWASEDEFRRYHTKNNSVFLGVAESHQKQSFQNEKLLPCREGTKWEEVSITLVSNEMVRIKTPGGKDHFTYHQLGLQDKRRGDRHTMLWLWLKLFAVSEGFISSKTLPRYDPKLPDVAKRLNKKLQEVFGIQDSIYTGHFKRENGYRTKIKFENQTYETISSILSF